MKKLLLFLLIIFSFLIFARMNMDFDKGAIFNNFNRAGVSPTVIPTNTIALGKMELTAWFAAWDIEKADTALPPIMDRFDTYSPMMYRVMAGSTLGRHNISNWEEILSYGRDNNLPIAPVITDEGETKRINKLLYNAKTQEAFIDEMISEAEKENFSGWSIDIEKITSEDHDAFSEFVKNLSIKLHAKGLKLYMIAYGRDAAETYDPALAHDYKIFGQYADEVQLMIYYYSNEYTAPGGQTPLKEYRSVLQYALENIPREKIVIGLSTHGNDWEGDNVTGMTYPEVAKLIEREKPNISYDSNELSMVAKYTVGDKEHILMYENADTILEKMRIAREEFQLNKFAFWRLSAEDPELWEKL